jgi:peptidoglycan/LPS O-acetylase OafA/YrhL
MCILSSQSEPKDTLEKTPKLRRFYNPALDGLRFFAFLAVFISHVSASIATAGGLPSFASAGHGWASWVSAAHNSGLYGVDLFFVLSSFLITRLLLIEKETRGKVDIGSFYVRRILRIWPLYYAFLLYMFVTQLAGSPKTPTLMWFGFLFFFVNWIATFHGLSVHRGSMLWTVSVEEQFYLTWPWIVSRVSRQAVVRICTGLVLFAIALRVVLTAFHAPASAIAFNTLARLDPLAMGAILAASPRLEKWFAGLSWPLLYPPLCAICVIAVTYAQTSRLLPALFVDPASIFLVALSCAFAVGCMLRTDSATLKVVSWKPLVYLGRISYGLYVYHQTVIGLAARLVQRLGLPESIWYIAPLDLVGTIVVASLSFRLIERPFLSLKERFAKVPSRPGG